MYLVSFSETGLVQSWTRKQLRQLCYGSLWAFSLCGFAFCWVYEILLTNNNWVSQKNSPHEERGADREKIVSRFEHSFNVVIPCLVGKRFHTHFAVWLWNSIIELAVLFMSVMKCLVNSVLFDFLGDGVTYTRDNNGIFSNYCNSTNCLHRYRT